MCWNEGLHEIYTLHWKMYWTLNRPSVCNVIFLLLLLIYPPLILQKWLIREDCGAVREGREMGRKGDLKTGEGENARHVCFLCHSKWLFYQCFFNNQKSKMQWVKYPQFIIQKLDRIMCDHHSSMAKRQWRCLHLPFTLKMTWFTV